MPSKCGQQPDIHLSSRNCPANSRFVCVPMRCTNVEFQLHMKRKSTYFEAHEYSLSDLNLVSTIKYAFFSFSQSNLFVKTQ